eukprot:scaffold300386_cov30-Tisochrysis_lutea.AAC.5
MSKPRTFWTLSNVSQWFQSLSRRIASTLGKRRVWLHGLKLGQGEMISYALTCEGRVRAWASSSKPSGEGRPRCSDS